MTRQADDLPDMTLPDREQAPTLPTKGGDYWQHVRVLARADEMITPRGPGKAPLDDDGPDATYTFAQRSEWAPGARVLAPWEPAYRYVGRIMQVKEDTALIEFDDGGSGWVHVDEIRPFDFHLEQEVMCRREESPFYFAARILELRDDQVRVRYEDGVKEWTGIASMRVATEAMGQGVKVVQPAGWQEFYDHLAPGERVWAPWNAGELFAGTVTRVRGDKVHVAYDDGDEGWTMAAQLLPLAIPIGLRVFCRKRWTSGYDRAIVKNLDGARVHLHFDNGTRDWRLIADVAIPCQPTGPNARATKTAWRLDVVEVARYWPYFVLAAILSLVLGVCILNS